MVNSRKENARIDEAISTGRDNAAIRPDVEGWCTHLHVETLGVSMVGQMAGVPIGPHQLSCQHAEYSIQSVVLRSLFQGFLVDNCINCPHRQPGTRPAFAESCLASHREAILNREEAAKMKNQRIEDLRRELVELANNKAASSQQEAASLLRLVVDLFANNESNTTHLLCETTKVASELFEEKAVDLLVLGISDEAFAAKCLPVLTCLTRKESTIRERIRQPTIAASKLDLPIEMVSESIGACFQGDFAAVPDEQISLLIEKQDYQRPFGGWEENTEPTFTATIGLLSILIDTVGDRVAAIVEARLQIEEKWSRANTCRVVQELSKLRSEFGVRVLPSLIRSIELDDDIYDGVSGDASAIDAIAELLVLSWPKTDEIILREMPSLSVEAQSTLVGAYEKLFRRGDDWRDETTDGLDEQVVSGAVRRCLELLGDRTQAPSVRRAAAEALHSACSAGAKLALDAVDQLLGTLAIIVASKPPAARLGIILPGKEKLQRQETLLDQQNNNFEWDRLKQEIRKTIEEIGRRNPLPLGKFLISTVAAALSAEHKSLVPILLELLGEIASHDIDVAGLALPLMMRCLMDYKSTIVRAVAIDAVMELFSHSRLTMPANIVDVLVLHLRDEYVMVHKSAVSAFRFRRVPLTEVQRSEAFSALSRIWKIYAKDPNACTFMDDIADALLSVASYDDQMRHITLGLVCEYVPSTWELGDAKLCERLIRHTESDLQISIAVAKAIIRCLVRHRRDRLRNGRDWREDASNWLMSISTQVWNQVSKEFKACAQEVPQRDPREGLMFASVFSEHGEHTDEARVLEIAANSSNGHSVFHGLHAGMSTLHQRAFRLAGEDPNAQ